MARCAVKISPDVVVLRAAQWGNACVCTSLCNKSWNTMWLPLTATKKIHYYVNEAPLSLRTRIPRFLAEIKSSLAHSLKKCRYSAGDITVSRSLKSCRCDIPCQVECSHATAVHISLRSQLDPLLTAMCCVEYEVWSNKCEINGLEGMDHQLLCHGSQNSVSLSPRAAGGCMGRGGGIHYSGKLGQGPEKVSFLIAPYSQRGTGTSFPSVTRLEATNEQDICHGDCV
jgi:hypothetical protein